MPRVMLAGPLAAAALLLPALVLLVLALLADAPGEWGRGALLAWTALSASLVAGATLQAAGGAAPWIVPLLGLVALMIGGPPGLLVAAAAALAAATLAGLPAPRWLPVALAVPAVVAAARHYLT